MSAYHGPQGTGASRRRREQKRIQADTRNALTAPERRSRKSSPAALNPPRRSGVTNTCDSPSGGEPRTNQH